MKAPSAWTCIMCGDDHLSIDRVCPHLLNDRCACGQPYDDHYLEWHMRWHDEKAAERREFARNMEHALR